MFTHVRFDAVADVPNVIPLHCPGAVSVVEVNTIGDPDVPFADNAPFTVSTRDVALPCTVTPALIVSVTPDATVTLPVITYGEPPTVQVVFVEIDPDTFVAHADEPNASQASTDHATISGRHLRIRHPYRSVTIPVTLCRCRVTPIAQHVEERSRYVHKDFKTPLRSHTIVQVQHSPARRVQAYGRATNISAWKCRAICPESEAVPLIS